MSSPRVLAVTSDGAPPSAVTPVLAALEVVGLEVSAVDVGRAGSTQEGAMNRFVRAIAGELAERRLDRLMDDEPVDVAIAFDPATVASLTAIRDDSARPAPVLAVVADLAPTAGWGSTSADRYLVVDDVAAVALADAGVDAQRVVPVGPVAPFSHVAAGHIPRASLRKRFKIAGGRPVVLVRVAGFGYDTTQQIALQLSLIKTPVTYLFDAGKDTEAAEALRRQVPTLDLKAKLFGQSSETASYWRAADVVVAPPDLAYASRALVVGARFVALVNGDGSAAGESLGRAVAERELGALAPSPLLLSSALEELLASGAGESAQRPSHAGVDGAGSIADVAWVVGHHAADVIADNRSADFAETRHRVRQASSFARAEARASQAPGELEDLSAGGTEVGAEPVSTGEIDSLRADVKKRMEQLSRAVGDAQTRAQRADQLAAAKERAGDGSAAEARKVAETERARMHAMLGELAQLTRELEELDAAEAAARSRPNRLRPTPDSASTRAPRSPRRGGRAAGGESVDDLLDRMKRDQMKRGAAGKKPAPASSRKRKSDRPRDAGERSSVEDELAALKRRVQNQKRPK